MVLTDTTTKSRNQNRKATALVAVFRALDFDEYEPGHLSEAGWKLAVRAAYLALPEDERPATPWTDASWDTRRLAADMHRTGIQTADAIFDAVRNGTR